jgi:predicted GNAT family acetyltransferase
MPETAAKPRLSENREMSRFELRLDDRLVALADYVREGETISFTHTFVEPELRGRGLAAELIEFALSAARDAGLQVLPHCWYVRDHIAARPQLLHLVPESRRLEFGLAGE